MGYDIPSVRRSLSTFRYNSCCLQFELMALFEALTSLKMGKCTSPVSPSQDMYQMGEDCGSCRQKIEPQFSVSICKCKKYSHLKCLIEKFNSFVLSYQRPLICPDCSQQINAIFQVKSMKKLHFGCSHALELSVAVLILFYCCLQLVKEVRSNISHPPQMPIGIVIMYSLGVLLSSFWIMQVCWSAYEKKEVRVKKIQPIPQPQSLVEQFNPSNDFSVNSQFVAEVREFEKISI